MIVTDLYGAAFLLATDHHVVGVESAGPKRIAFIFQESEGVRQDYLRFVNNAPIPVQDLVSGVYRLKRLLKEAKKEP